MKRHFTATGFVVRGDATLLHWHQRLGQWMPPGGHIEPDEDPVQAVLREIREEAGAEAELLPSREPLPFASPGQLPPPYTILVEEIDGPGEPHQHIDLIYFCRLLDGREPSGAGFHWVDEATLRSGRPLDLAGCGVAVPLAEDVRLLALKAIEAARGEGG
jgi:8-oxo-dGTP pyrophosphatase MutT (NUDIX family)